MQLILMSLLLISGTVRAADVHVKFMDLKSLVESRNERVQAALHETEAAQARQGHLARSFLPKIEAHAAHESFKTGTHAIKSQPDYGAEASVNVYNGGRDRLKEDELQLRSQRRTFEAKAYAVQELGKARELYWIVVYKKNVASLLKEMADINAANLGAAQKRVRSGVATESDRLEFEMNAIELRREREENELATRAAARDLLVLLGYSADDRLSTETEITHLGEWESEIKHTHKDHEFLVKPAELMAAESRLSAEQSARSWWPRVDAYAGWNQYNQREEDPPSARERQESVVGVRLKINAFDGLSSRRESQALHKEAEAARLMAKYQQKQNEAHVEKEFDELYFLHQQVHEADENIKSAQRYYRITQGEYARGVKNSPDVLGASEKLFAMKLKRLQMIRDFQIARSHVLSKIGK